MKVKEILKKAEKENIGNLSIWISQIKTQLQKLEEGKGIDILVPAYLGTAIERKLDEFNIPCHLVTSDIISIAKTYTALCNHEKKR
jgi:hypothetical protein